MRTGTLLGSAVLALTLASAAPLASAQISIHIGPEPACPYGYYDYAPYRCAPYGYYGPNWFSGGGFIGAGPWFHGPRYYHGYVDNHYDPRFGYHGYYPHPGDRAWAHGEDRSWNHFHGNAERDGRGHDFHGR